MAESRRTEYGVMFMKRGDPGDREKALQIFDQALATANEIGLRGLIREVNALKSQEHRLEPLKE